MNPVASQRPDRVERSSQATTLRRHAAALAADRGAPQLETLVAEIAFAAKVVARETRRAALTGRLGTVGSANVSGDPQKELDLLANRIFLDCLDASGRVAAVVSEELEGDRHAWSDRLGLWAFWLYNLVLVMWVVMNFLPVGIPQLDAVHEKGYAYARSLEFYQSTVFWQWLRTPGDVVFAVGDLLMAADFIIKITQYFRARPQPAPSLAQTR